MSFKNKVAIVTGAGQGIGYEIGRRLVKEGAKVVLNDLDPDLSESAADNIRKENKDSCISVPGDASTPAIIQKLVGEAVGKFGKLDIVIANAGITLYGEFLTYTPDAFRQVMQVNLAGSFFLAQAAANHMIRLGKGGSILFTSSVTGHQAHKNLAAYSMSKAALEMLAKNLVIELSEYKINVNTIAPGATQTERTLQDPSYSRVWSEITPLGRPASVEDIADATLFLVSEKAKHITGQSIVIDGGWTSVSPPPK